MEFIEFLKVWRSLPALQSVFVTDLTENTYITLLTL